MTATVAARIRYLIRRVAIVVVGIIIAAPLLYLFLASFMDSADMSAYPITIIPSHWQFSNYVEAFGYLTTRTVLNTVGISLAIVLIQLVLTSLMGFALAKIPMRGSRILIALLVLPNFIPGDLTLIPTFVVTFKLGLLNSYAGIVLPIACQIAFGALLFRQAFVELPAGLIEAARIDGAGWLRTFGSICLPLAGPTVAAFSSITFLGAWNQYIWPQLVANNEEHQVLNVALAPLATSQYSLSSPGVAMAAAVISMIPVLIVFSATQRWFIQGLAGSGVD